MNLLAVYTSVWFGLEEDYASSNIRFLALAYFPFAVDIPYRLSQKLENVGSFDAKSVVHIVHRSDVRFASFKRAGHAQQADKIRIVGMEELTVQI